MRKSIFFLKKLTSAEVGETKTHEKYVRLPNDFDYESFFPGLAKENGNVIQVDFTAKNCTIGHSSEPSMALKFVFYANSNQEKRIPSLSYVFAANNVQAEDVVCIESRTENGKTTYYITFTKSNMASLNPAAVTYVILTENSIHENGHKKQSINLQQIYYGAPGTGKSHAINEKTEGESVIRTTFHPDSDYSTFVGAYKPTMGLLPICDELGQPMKIGSTVLHKEQIIYEFVDQAFLQAYVQAWKYYAENSDNAKRQYLVIEEINRGNCAQIFGDLFQLLDRNDYGFSVYPINADKDMKKQLAKAFKKDGKTITIEGANKINALYKGKDVVSQVLSGDILLLPDNLCIWATMNTSDQSLFPIDSAFKRRWEWQYMPIDKGYDANGQEIKWAIEGATKKFDWWSFLEKINAQISEATQSEDKKLGFFFCKATDGLISAEKFVGKVIFYLWNDVFKNNGFEGPIFKDVDGTELSFSKFYKSDSKGNAIVQKDKVELFLNNLGVEEYKVDINLIDNEDEDDSASNKFQLDGEGQDSLNKIAMKVVMNFAKNNPSFTAQQIRDIFIEAYKGAGIAHIVETEAEYSARSHQASAARTVSEILLKNGEKVYVSTQLRAKNEGDNFFNFIRITHEKGWGNITPA